MNTGVYFSFLLCLVVSCKASQSTPDQANSEQQAVSEDSFSTSSKKTIFSDKFDQGCWNATTVRGSRTGSCENPVNKPLWLGSQMQTNAAGRVVNFTGSKAMRFIWDKNYYKPLVGNTTALENNTSKKAHLWTEFESGRNKTRSYYFSIYAPKDNFSSDEGDEGFLAEIVSQWKGYPNRSKNEPYNLPVLALKAYRGKWVLEGFYDEKEVTPLGGLKASFPRKYLDNIAKDKWTDFHVRVKWSCCSDEGYVLVQSRVRGKTAWETKFKSTDIKIGQNDVLDPNWGIGIYKYNGNSNFRKRIVYFDDILVTN